MMARFPRYPKPTPGEEALLLKHVSQFPHCDQSVLHAPGECTYCDRHPDWQALRIGWGINFTGHHDADKAPCPSTHWRTDEVRDRWGGNVPVPGGYVHTTSGVCVASVPVANATASSWNAPESHVLCGKPLPCDVHGPDGLTPFGA